jgi:serine/threonine-protein kinase
VDFVEHCVLQAATVTERARFRAEAEAAARLQHPNIVPVDEVGEADGRPFLALEHVSGGSLAARLAGDGLEPRAAPEVVAQLAEAVQHDHSHGIVHRDLKPANLLLTGVMGQVSVVSQDGLLVTGNLVVQRLNIRRAGARRA